MRINVPGMPEAPVGSGFQLPDPGDYRLLIREMEEDERDPSKPKIIVTFEVIDGPQQRGIVKATNSFSPVGMTAKEFIPNQPNCAFRAKNLAVAAGAMSRDDEDTDYIDTEKCIGQLVDARISHKEYNGNIQLVFKYLV